MKTYFKGGVIEYIQIEDNEVLIIEYFVYKKLENCVLKDIDCAK